MLSTAIDRLCRVLGGQILGNAVAQLLAYVVANPGDPAFYGFGLILGSSITALDKYLRDIGVYGSSLESEQKKVS